MYIMATKKWGPTEGKNTKHNSPISRQCKCNRIHPRDTRRGCALYIQYLHVLHICPLILQNSNKQTIFPGHFSVAWIKYKQQFLFVFQPGYGKPCTSATLLFMHPFLPQSAEFNDNIWWRLPPCFPIPQKKPLSTGPECNCLKLYSVRYTYPIYFYIISCINVINKFQFEFVCGFSFVCDNCMNHLHIGCTVFDRR